MAQNYTRTVLQLALVENYNEIFIVRIYTIIFLFHFKSVELDLRQINCVVCGNWWVRIVGKKMLVDWFSESRYTG